MRKFILLTILMLSFTFIININATTAYAFSLDDVIELLGGEDSSSLSSSEYNAVGQLLSHKWYRCDPNNDYKILNNYVGYNKISFELERHQYYICQEYVNFNNHDYKINRAEKIKYPIKNTNIKWTKIKMDDHYQYGEFTFKCELGKFNVDYNDFGYNVRILKITSVDNPNEAPIYYTEDIN